MLKVPIYKQTYSFCGPTSLKMLLAYYGLNLSERKIAKLAGATREEGVRGENLLKVAKKLGFRGMIIDRANIKNIKYFVKKRIPVIVSWFCINEGHYSVVVNVTKKYIYINDPETGQRKRFKISDFFKVWFDVMINEKTLRASIAVRSMMVIFPKKFIAQ